MSYHTGYSEIRSFGSFRQQTIDNQCYSDSDCKQCTDLLCRFSTISVASTNELGPPDSHIYSPADLRASVIEYDIHFTNISQDWNEYPDEGTCIRIQPIVTSLKNIKV
ncbi:MAG: hypothetical protein ACRD8W_02895 [Nitrososphaeraceae archaeon]